MSVQRALDSSPASGFDRVVLDTLVILAPGLLGGSVALAARARGAARRIVVWARRPEARLQLRSQPWCDAAPETPEEAVREASLVVIAAPVNRIVELAQRVGPHLPAGARVTDVGSVKAELCRFAAAAMPPHATFVGAHPMAGSEKTGWENGSATLFEKRTVFVTPLPGTADEVTAAVAAFWHALGGEVVTATPDAHDEIVAHISHLPQALATSLAGFLGARNAAWRNVAGNGLRDTTRIAAGDPTMWLEIFQQNRDEVLRAIDGWQDEVQGLRAALANRDWSEIRTRLERGKAWRDGFRP